MLVVIFTVSIILFTVTGIGAFLLYLITGRKYKEMMFISVGSIMLAMLGAVSIVGIAVLNDLLRLF